MRNLDHGLVARHAAPKPYERKEAGSGGDDNLATEVKRSVDALMRGFDEFKRTNDERIKQIETKGVADPVTLEKLSKLEQTLSGFEGINQKLTALELEAKKQKESLDEIEKKAKRPATPGSDQAKLDLKRTVNLWARGVFNAYSSGVANLPEDQKSILAAVAAEAKANMITPDTSGGYLAPTEFVQEIIKGVTEITPARQLARVRQTTFKSMQIPRRTGQFAARRVAENGTKTETTGLEYGLEEFPLPEMYALVDISNQMMEDSAFDMQAEILMEANEQFSVKEGQEFVTGTGVNELEGILVNNRVGSNNSGNATAITADGVLLLKYGVKTAYTRNANYLLNRTTLGQVRTLKDGSGNYLWMPGIAMGRPNTIDGDPYVEAVDMPNAGAGTAPMVYGDFRRAYTMGDRIAMEMLRDPYTQATSGNVRFIFRRRVGGMVTLAEAIRKLICST